MTDTPSMAELQEADYGADRDYTHGSPHLRHPHLRDRIESTLRELVRGLIEQHGYCNAIEVGAGHGTFTTVLADAGAEVVVTEMSHPSADYLTGKFAEDPKVRVVFDEDGSEAERVAAEGYNLLVCVSVLHHIPDYKWFLEKMSNRLDVGGAVFTAQDPLWYPGRSRIQKALTAASYTAWRLGQGDLRRGVTTQVRRLRGVYDETNPADMVEYHVVRNGVDQDSIRTIFNHRFTDVQQHTYWSTQSPRLQRVGERVGLASEFSFVATGRTERYRYATATDTQAPPART